MATYAKDTSVSSDRSLTEIRNTIRRYGASGFAYMERDDSASVAFEYANRQVRFQIRFPDPDDPAFTRTPTGLNRTESAARVEHEKAVRQRWRALALVVKAKLEAVEAEIATFDQEFLPYLVLPGGRTVFETVGEQVAQSIESGVPGRLMLEG